MLLFLFFVCFLYVFTWLFLFMYFWEGGVFKSANAVLRLSKRFCRAVAISQSDVVVVAFVVVHTATATGRMPKGWICSRHLRAATLRQKLHFKFGIPSSQSILTPANQSYS